MTDSPIENTNNIEAFGKIIAAQAATLIQNGMTPGDVVGALCAGVYATMKSVGLSDMQCSNALHKLADDVRDKHWHRERAH